MMRIFILFFVAACLSLVVFAQNYDSNSMNESSNFCTGGACRIDKMKENNFLQNNQNNNIQFYPYSDSDSSKNRGGLNNNSNYTYDFNCQFGNCLPDPSGSYKP